MLTLTKQQVIDYINSQPDERPVDMMDFIAVPEDKCGCLLVHIFRDKFPACKADIGASTKRVWVRAHRIALERSIGHFVCYLPQATTYKGLKQQALTW